MIGPNDAQRSSASDTIVGAVGLLIRFPVKSTAGETLTSAAVDSRGLLHDRQWAAYTSDGGIASGKTSRRFRKVEGLMRWRSTVTRDDGSGEELSLLHSPDGDTYRVDDPAASTSLGRALGQPLTLRREAATLHYDECGVHLGLQAHVVRTGTVSLGDQARLSPA